MSCGAHWIAHVVQTIEHGNQVVVLARELPLESTLDEKQGVGEGAHSSRNQQVLRERPFAVNPLSIATESSPRRHLRNFFCLVLVRAVCPNRFCFVRYEPQIGGRNVR